MTASSGEDVLARRAAVAEIGERAATGALDRIALEAARATNLIGLTGPGIEAYRRAVEGTLPLAFRTLRLADGPERDAGIDELTQSVRSVSDTHHIPRIVERGLMAIATRIGREVVRREAPSRGFEPDELERELVSFADALSGRLFAD